MSDLNTLTAADRSYMRTQLGVFAPASLLLASFGDSRALGGAAPAARYANLWAVWLEALSLGRVQVPGILGLGHSGYTTAMLADPTLLATDIAKAKAGGANGVILTCSTNDRNGGLFTAAQSIANLAIIEAAWLAAGFFVIWMAETPRGDSYWTGTNNPPTQPALDAVARLPQHLAVHRWIMDRRLIPGVTVVDTFAALADRTSYANGAAGYARLGLLVDGLHYSTRGAYEVAKSMLTAIRHLIPPGGPVLPSLAADSYDAVTGTGSIVRNPTMNGTGGSALSGAGNVATSWQGGSGTLPAGVTQVFSKVTVEGREWQQIAYSGTAPTGTPLIRALQRDTAWGTNGVAAGKVYRAFCEYEIDAGQTGVYCIDPYLQQTAGGPSGNSCDQGYAASPPSFGELPNEAYRGVFMTDPFTLDQASGFLRAAINVKFVPQSAVSLTLRVGNFAVMPV